jgi:DNA repair protein RecO (recombination protein O)
LQLAKSRDLDIITQAETIEPYLEIKEDLLRFGTASHVIELVDRFSREEGENRALYLLLVDTLHRIQSEADLFIATRFFELRLLDLAGYRPELFQCVTCGMEVQAEDQFLSIEKGGVLCPSCGRNDPESRAVSLNALRYLRHLQRSDYRDASRAAPTEAVRREMESLLAADLEHYLGSRLRSREFLRKIKDLK